MSSLEESSFSNKLRKKTYFTEDLWLEIFPYLRLNLIYKFKCISKVWKFHLSSPNFIHKWIQFNNNNTLSPWMLFHIFKQNSIRKFTIAYLDSHSRLISNHSGFSFEFLNQNSSCYPTLYFLGSSNGLVLCLKHTIHYVCNPLTQKWVELPPTPHQNDEERLETLAGFVCKCSSSITSYKVVRIPPWQTGSNKFNIQVFSSDSGKWEFYEILCQDGVILRSLERPSVGLPTGGVLISRNVLYWMGWYNVILAYDLENNESAFRQCRVIELPDRGNCSSRFLGESNGSIFYARMKSPEATLCVWVLEEENFYLLQNNIELHDLFAEIDTELSASFAGIRSGDVTKVIGFNPVDSNVVMIGCKNHIWAYDTRTKRYDELCHPSFLGNEHSGSDIVYLPLLLKPMPTMLPLRSW